MTTNYRRGDIVQCNATHYKSYALGELAEVLDFDGHLITLKNAFSQYDTSQYLARNWKFHHRPEPKEKTKMANAYEKTKYFGVRLSKNQRYEGCIDIDNDEMTKLHDSKHAAITDTQSIMKEGEDWVILQTIARVRLAEPKPPIVVTEYK